MATQLSPGDLINGYRITSELLNMGQFANAYFARAPDGTPVFFKQYSDPTPLYSWYKPFIEYQKRLQAEISKMPSAIREAAVAIFEDGGTFYQVFPLLKGKSLRWFMDESVRNPSVFDDSLRLISAKLFLYALRMLHEMGICHCDLKPENLFIDDSDGTTLIGKKIKLIDFDFSFFVRESPPWVPAGKEGRPGFVGTPGYFSPEHIRGEIPCLASDVFTAAIVLFEILCGRPPFTGWDSPEGFLSMAARGDHPRASDLNPDLPSGFSELLDRALNSDPGRRPSIIEIQESLLESPKTRPGTLSSASPAPRPGPRPAVTPARVSSVFPAFIKLMIREPDLYRPVQDTELIGQDQLRIFPDSAYVSARQFRIIKDTAGKLWAVEGLPGVTNNTRLNGTVVTGTTAPLKDGDIISVGQFKASIRFH